MLVKKVRFVPFIVLLCGNLLWGQSNDPFKVVEATSNKVVFSLQPPDLQINQISIADASYDVIRLSGYGVETEPGRPMLPQTGALISIPANAQVSVGIVESSFKEIPNLNLAPVPEVKAQSISDSISYLYKKDLEIYQSDLYYPQKLAEFAGRGRWRGVEIGRIRVNPVQYNPVQKIVRVYEKLVIQVAWTGTPDLQTRAGQTKQLDHLQQRMGAFLLNSPVSVERKAPDVLSKLTAQSDWYHPGYTYYKLFVDREGVYSLTYDDLLNAGLPVNSMDLSRLKIFNKGNQIPIWIAGPQENYLTAQNVIYFWADRNRGDHSYYDAYTDTNVYWLTADGEAGLRYDLQSQFAMPGNPPPFYWQKKHFEEDHQYHRSNRSTTIEPEEGWIWRYFFEGEQQTVDFAISGLYTSAGLCSLRARLHGTTLDPVNPDHHVQLSINESVVVDAFFDDDAELLTVTEFPTELLHNGQNQLVIQLLADTGAQVNQIYLDWIEIIYPRQFAAIKSELRFSFSNSTSNPVEYHLTDFNDGEIAIFQPQQKKIWQPSTQKLSIYKVESAGFDDGKFVRFSIDDTTYFVKDRGHVLAIVDTATGEPEIHIYDTFGSGQAANDMADFINGLAEETLVLAGITDDGFFSMTEAAHLALESLGSALTRQVEGRDSWALVGRKGAPIGSVPEALSRRFEGPAATSDTLFDEYAFSYNTAFSDSALSDFYYAVSKSGHKKINRIEMDASSDLLSVNQGADYVIVTHRRFWESANRLASYRQNHDGYRTAVVDVQDIYDQFNYGIVSPNAIKDFLNYIYLNWQSPAPTYLVLFGDSSWDPKQLLDESPKIDFVASYGSLVSDNWYVTFDGDDDVLPEMFVGRIPVETEEQAEIVLNKIMDYESSPFAAWNKELLFLNGGYNKAEQDIFLSQANTLNANYLQPPPFSGYVSNLNKTTNEAISQAFIFQAADIIREGVLWVNFIGHAGSSIWDINIEGPEQWRNREVFPFMTGMSCHSARFANPVNNSLSETYFIHPMGAAAYWGSAGYGYITQDFYLLHGLFKAVTKDTIRMVGEATTLAKVYLWQQLGGQLLSRYVIEQYALVGDPAMALAVSRKPELAILPENISFTTDYFLTSDSIMTLQAQIHNYGLAPMDSINISVHVSDSNGDIVSLLKKKMPPIARVDSVSVKLPIPGTSGQYRILVSVDPDDEIEEENNINNSAEVEISVFSSDLTLLKPMNFSVLNNSSVELVTNNSRSVNENLSYYFEVDTSGEFSSPLLLQSPPVSEGKLATSWQVNLPIEATYYWRVRTFDGSNYGTWIEHSFDFARSSAAKWRQSEASQFTANILNKTDSNSNGSILLSKNKTVFEVESAGFVEGSHAFILRNGELVSLNKRGHNVAIFDETNGELLSTDSFDTFAYPADSDSLADFINDAKDGRIIIAAIHDEGSVSMNERAYQALEGIGSQYTRQVGGRDSWAIIGRKGAPVGSVPEAWKKSGEGVVVLVDSLIRFAKSGNAVSTEIGPALQWNFASFSYTDSDPATSLEFRVLGRNKFSGLVDTLRKATGVQEIDLAQINAGEYPELQLQALFTSDDGLNSPELNSWSVDFTPPADLVVGRGSITLNKDTLEKGEPLDIDLEAANFGLTTSDSFAVRIYFPDSGTEKELARIKAPGIGVDEFAHFSTTLPTDELNGQINLFVELDAEDVIPEINESNNEVFKTIWVTRDTSSPLIRLTMDGQEVGLGEFVSSRPQAVIEIHDRGQATFSDTALVTVFLDGNKISYGTGSGQAELIPQHSSDDNLRALVIFNPELAEGEHDIEVIAKDDANNLRYFQTEFYVSTEFQITEVMNYPNPFRDATEFTYTLTQAADQVRIKIYTIAGRLIHELDFIPTRVGFNSFRWDGLDRDGDPLANGVYLYKVIARQGDRQVETLEKFVVMR